MTESVKLEPCPFCGPGHPLEPITPCVTSIRAGGGQWWFVHCPTCDAQGPEYGCEAEAIAAWNRRHQPQEREAALRQALAPYGCDEGTINAMVEDVLAALKTTPAPAVEPDQALLTDIFDKMAEVVAPLPGIPDAPGDAGTRAIEPSDGDKR